MEAIGINVDYLLAQVLCIGLPIGLPIIILVVYILRRNRRDPLSDATAVWHGTLDATGLTLPRELFTADTDDVEVLSWNGRLVVRPRSTSDATGA